MSDFRFKYARQVLSAQDSSVAPKSLKARKLKTVPPNINYAINALSMKTGVSNDLSVKPINFLIGREVTLFNFSIVKDYSL